MKLKIELTRKHVTHYLPLSATCNTGKTAPYTTFFKRIISSQQEQLQIKVFLICIKHPLHLSGSHGIKKEIYMCIHVINMCNNIKTLFQRCVNVFPNTKVRNVYIFVPPRSKIGGHFVFVLSVILSFCPPL